MKEPEVLFEKSDKGPILYIRHGETYFNRDTATIITEDVAKHMKEYLDSKLTEKGKEQSENLSYKTSKYNIKYIFCSPLLRCIETCHYSLKDYPQKEKIRVIIHPFLTETVHCNHDFNRKTFHKKAIYNLNSEIKFDWSVFDSYFPDECTQESYFINFFDTNLDDENVQEIIMKIRDPDNFKNVEYMDHFTTQLSSYYANKNKRPESIKNLFFRNLKFKEYLENFLRENGDINPNNNEKVLVYTHSNFIQTSNSKIAYSMDKIEDFPEDSYKPKNCEIITIFI